MIQLLGLGIGLRLVGVPHYRDLELFSTLSMAREFISDYADTNSGDRRVVPEFLGKQRLSSEVRIRTFKKSR